MSAITMATAIAQVVWAAGIRRRGRLGHYGRQALLGEEGPRATKGILGGIHEQALVPADARKKLGNQGQGVGIEAWRISQRIRETEDADRGVVLGAAHLGGGSGGLQAQQFIKFGTLLCRAGFRWWGQQPIQVQGDGRQVTPAAEGRRGQRRRGCGDGSDRYRVHSLR